MGASLVEKTMILKYDPDKIGEKNEK